jgi:hypothetical protein
LYVKHTLTIFVLVGTPGPVGPSGERGFPGMNLL